MFLAFLQETDVEEWCLVNMDMALVQNNPGINKKTAHKYISEDLNTLEKLYPEIKIIQERVAFVKKELRVWIEWGQREEHFGFGSVINNYQFIMIEKKPRQ